MKRLRRGALVAMATVGLLGAAACGDDDDTAGAATQPSDTEGEAPDTAGDDASGDASDEVAAAQEVVEPFLQPATSINITEPLTSAPEEGITVAFLEGNLDSIRVITEGYQAAADALGWELNVYGYDLANPQTAASAMQQAIDEGVDYIVTSGLPSATYGASLANAQAADIPVVLTNVADEPESVEQGLVIGCIACTEMVTAWGELLANFIIADSEGTANALYVSIPEFSALGPESEAFVDTIEQRCSGCQVDVLDSTIASFSSGGLSGEIISYLQQNPDVDYVNTAIGQMASGLPEAMSAAGVGQNVKITFADPDLVAMHAIIDGDMHAAMAYPIEEHAWVTMDLIARHSLGMDLSPSIDAPIPMEILTRDTVAQPPALYLGPRGYEEQFLELWQLA